MKTVCLNENSRRIGESHPGAKLMDREIEQVFALLEAGFTRAEVAIKFDVSVHCIAHIACGRRRGQAVARTVREPYDLGDGVSPWGTVKGPK